MGQIAAAYDIMPESTEVNLDEVISKIGEVIPAGVKVLETEIKPVAFGLMKVYVGFLIDDSDEGVGDKLENGLRSISGVENVECVSSTNV